MVRTVRRALVIEDHRETAGQLADCLYANGYAADVAADGDAGLRPASTADYVVMTVDRLLLRIDGLEIIRRLRAQGIATPALILSALGEVDDCVRGLRAGGDDYLVKPFASREMLARVDALARRSTAVVKETILRIGDLEIDLLARTARRGDREIYLLPCEFQLLEYLARNVDQVVSPISSKDDIAWMLRSQPAFRPKALITIASAPSLRYSTTSRTVRRGKPMRRPMWINNKKRWPSSQPHRQR
jgi:two-component system OmpR family response regulator